MPAPERKVKGQEQKAANRLAHAEARLVEAIKFRDEAALEYETVHHASIAAWKAQTADTQPA